MKKLKLNASAFQSGEVLTRSQLKKVLGGSGSGTDDCKPECSINNPCPTGEKCEPFHCETGGEYRVCIVI